MTTERTYVSRSTLMCLGMMAVFMMATPAMGTSLPTSAVMGAISNQVSNAGKFSGIESFLDLWRFSLKVDGNAPEIRNSKTLEPKTILGPSENSFMHLIPQDVADPLYLEEQVFLRRGFLLDHMVLEPIDPNDPKLLSPQGITSVTMSGKNLTIWKDADGAINAGASRDELGVSVKRVSGIKDGTFIYELQNPLFNGKARVRNAQSNGFRSFIDDALGPPLDLFEFSSGAIIRPPAIPHFGAVGPPALPFGFASHHSDRNLIVRPPAPPPPHFEGFGPPVVPSGFVPNVSHRNVLVQPPAPPPSQFEAFGPPVIPLDFILNESHRNVLVRPPAPPPPNFGPPARPVGFTPRDVIIKKRIPQKNVFGESVIDIPVLRGPPVFPATSSVGQHVQFTKTVLPPSLPTADSLSHNKFVTSGQQLPSENIAKSLDFGFSSTRSPQQPLWDLRHTLTYAKQPLTKFITLLTVADYKFTNEVTLLAPIDSAINSKIRCWRCILLEEGRGISLLGTHILRGSWLTPSLLMAGSLEAIDGTTIIFRKAEDGSTTANGVPFIKTDLIAIDGVAHVLGDLLPSTDLGANPASNVNNLLDNHRTIIN